ncbi:MAG TPA: hypothetical protein IAB44_11135 [Candidatus Limivivens intestinipullorum]|uniref:Uncharacterized protein n=1 Tax=Candidatus Limivivens intestinipullorum TaxID=2840858 RepID=A0A9D1EUA3_9FIRM|nr:hypothetical protein [Candidatus Limivivens intestinipullorum]
MEGKRLKEKQMKFSGRFLSGLGNSNAEKDGRRIYRGASVALPACA